MNYEILFEDDELLIVYKPANLATQTAKVGEEDLCSLLSKYRVEKGEDPFIGVITRLDQPVEGVVAFGKTSRATDELSKQLRERKITKKYYCIITSERLPEKGTLTDYLVKDTVGSKAKVVNENYPRAKRAELQYRTLKRDSEGALLEVTLITGRFHQIRVQLASRMAPILGDVKYGGKSNGKPLALCAYDMSLLHPLSKEPIHITINPKGEEFSHYL
ncbi:MAG: RNA pseudouridine synthase [Lachnospiraceae bacterium]|nr:RNA pseudouridine synthase [Lachnospiraceae bacterium]